MIRNAFAGTGKNLPALLSSLDELAQQKFQFLCRQQLCVSAAGVFCSVDGCALSGSLVQELSDRLMELIVPGSFVLGCMAGLRALQGGSPCEVVCRDVGRYVGRGIGFLHGLPEAGCYGAVAGPVPARWRGPAR